MKADKVVTVLMGMGNEAMQTAEEVAAALRKVADRIENGARSGLVMDENGNSVGSWSVGR